MTKKIAMISANANLIIINWMDKTNNIAKTIIHNSSSKLKQ